MHIQWSEIDAVFAEFGFHVAGRFETFADCPGRVAKILSKAADERIAATDPDDDDGPVKPEMVRWFLNQLKKMGKMPTEIPIRNAAFEPCITVYSRSHHAAENHN